jgi:hypothetical protein
MESASDTRRAIILGKNLQARAGLGKASAKLEIDEILDSLTRNQDRKMFDLDPLPKPEPDNQSTENSPASGLLEAAVARRRLAVEAWRNGSKFSDSERLPLRSELVDSVIAWEKLTGELFAGIENRASFGLSDRPGERLANG